MNLIWKGFIIENLLSSVNRVGDDNDFGDAFLVASLIDSASDSKQFYFSAGDEGYMMNCFDQGLVTDVDMRNRSSDIVLDARIRDNNCCVGRCGCLNSHVI